VRTEGSCEARSAAYDMRDPLLVKCCWITMKEEADKGGERRKEASESGTGISGWTYGSIFELCVILE